MDGLHCRRRLRRLYHKIQTGRNTDGPTPLHIILVWFNRRHETFLTSGIGATGKAVWARRCIECYPVFGRLLPVMVRPMLRDRCPVCPCVCNVGILWSNGWLDQDTTWYGGRLRPRRHCIRRGPNSTHRKGHNSPPPLFGSCLLWPNGRPTPISATASCCLLSLSGRSFPSRCFFAADKKWHFNKWVLSISSTPKSTLLYLTKSVMSATCATRRRAESGNGRYLDCNEKFRLYSFFYTSQCR